MAKRFKSKFAGQRSLQCCGGHRVKAAGRALSVHTGLDQGEESRWSRHAPRPRGAVVMARSRFNDPIEPMTLQSMRENGVW
jgi:hypothetical protein